MSVLIKNGRVITPLDDVIADVYIEGQVISRIGTSLDVSASTIIDARDKYVLPGCVDPHTHLESAFLDASSADDYTSGTIAAAFGGTTSIVEFVEPARGEDLSRVLAACHEKLRACQPVVDIGFHLIVVDVDDRSLALLGRIASEGITSFKLFMAFPDSFMVDDEALFRAMQVAAQADALVMVHAENGGAIEVLVRQAVESGMKEPRYHAATRPVEAEAEATNRAIQLAALAGCGLYLVHISCAEAVDVIARARAANQPVWAETCPHYLLFDESVLEGDQGARYVYTPPPRPKDHQSALWRALQTDVLSVVATDHSAYPSKSKALGDSDFSSLANGVPGIEERLMLMHHFGVREGWITLQRMVELLATNPAKLFGLFPRKGTLAPGSDADIVVFDPSRPRTLSAATQHSRCDYTIYEGMTVIGSPETVLVRGTPVILDGQLVVEPGHGEFLRRGPYLDSMRKHPRPNKSIEALGE